MDLDLGASLRSEQPPESNPAFFRGLFRHDHTVASRCHEALCPWTKCVPQGAGARAVTRACSSEYQQDCQRCRGTAAGRPPTEHELYRTAFKSQTKECICPVTHDTDPEVEELIS